MVIITIIGELLAKKNELFIYCGPLSECRECKLKTVCFNLELGRQYCVKSVRDVHHDCRIHEDGVRVVEVENAGILASVPSKLAIDGATFSFKSRDCPIFSCENYWLCHPFGVNAGTKYRISSVEGNLSCEEGQSLRKVLLS